MDEEEAELSFDQVPRNPMAYAFEPNFTKEIKNTLKKSMEYALRNANTLPTIDISVELEELKKL